MSVKKSLRKKCLYGKRRHWYHISITLNKPEVHLKPLGSDSVKCFNRSGYEPWDERICVAPTVAHCLTAVPYTLSERYCIYRTKNPVKANPPKDVFDSNVTLEGWIQKPTTFVKIGTLDLEDVEIGENVEHVIPEAASSSEPRYSGKVYSWWKKHKLRRYIKRA